MSVSVLMYHHVLRRSGFITSSVDEFRDQMKFLSQNGYKTLSSAEFIAYKNGELEVPKKSVFITFDDGWKDNFIYAYPIIKEFGLKATVFLVSSWIEAASRKHGRFIELSHGEYKKVAPQRPEDIFLNFSEIEKMSECFDFHSHTHTHFDDYFGVCDIGENFTKCKEFMQKNFGFDDKLLCWPRGKFDERLLDIAKNIGYEVFFTTRRGVNKPDKKLDDIRRIAIKKGANWLRKTLFIYQNNLLGSVYSVLKT
jgi:Na+/H+ antiporter NhaD